MSRLDHFNFLGPVYDLVFGRAIDHDMVEIAGLQPDHKLLDVGGGTGRVAVLFKEITDQILIVDSAIGMLRKAQDKGLRTVNGNSERLPVRTGAFDRVIMVDALHHVRDQAETLQETWRVLAPGGQLVIEEPDIHNFWVKLVALGEKILLMRSRFLPPEEIVEICQFMDRDSIQLIKNNSIAWIIITKSNSIHREEKR
jgi:ubiquinone/menaquinone biosynthesis C-methylase UbiE